MTLDKERLTGVLLRRKIGGHVWEINPLGFHHTLEEAKESALNVRKGGYFATIVRVKSRLGFAFVKKRNGRVVKEPAPYEYVVYRRWDKDRCPRECLPKNILGRRRS